MVSYNLQSAPLTPLLLMISCPNLMMAWKGIGGGGHQPPVALECHRCEQLGILLPQEPTMLGRECPGGNVVAVVVVSTTTIAASHPELPCNARACTTSTGAQHEVMDTTLREQLLDPELSPIFPRAAPSPCAWLCSCLLGQAYTHCC